MRHLLELRTAELFAQSWVDDQASEMVAAAQSVRAFGDDLDQLVAMDIRFRQAIARASGKRTSTRSSARSSR